jgi:hypothetical protein
MTVLAPTITYVASCPDCNPTIKVIAAVAAASVAAGHAGSNITDPTLPPAVNAIQK